MTWADITWVDIVIGVCGVISYIGIVYNIYDIRAFYKKKAKK